MIAKARTVTAAYAKANLPELLQAVSKGHRVTISRYNKPIADLIPSNQLYKPPRKLGGGKGKAKILDARWAEPMTDQEAEDFTNGRW